MQFNSEIVIDRPADEVFAYWADLERAPEWAAPVIERRKLTEGPVGVGSRFHAVDKYPLRRVEFDMEITALEPGRLMAATWFKPMEGGWEARFSESDGSTRLTLQAEVRPAGLLRLLSPIAAPWAKRQILKDLRAFKSRLEGGASD